MSAHEDLSRAHDVRGGSDRSFGFTFTVFFGLLGLWPRVAEQGAHVAPEKAASKKGAIDPRLRGLRALLGLPFQAALSITKGRA